MLIVGFTQTAASGISSSVAELKQVGDAFMHVPLSERPLYLYESISRLNNVREGGPVATPEEQDIIAQALIRNATVPGLDIGAASLARFYMPESFIRMSPVQQTTRRAYFAISLLALAYTTPIGSKSKPVLPDSLGDKEAKAIVEGSKGPIVGSDYWGEFRGFLESRFGEGKSSGFKEDLQKDLIKWYGLFKRNYKAADTPPEFKDRGNLFPVEPPINPLLGTYQKVLDGLVGSLKRSQELSPSGDITTLNDTEQKQEAAYLLEKQASFLIRMDSKAYLATIKSYGLLPNIAYDLSALAYFYWTNPEARHKGFDSFKYERIWVYHGWDNMTEDWREILSWLNPTLDLQEKSGLSEGKALSVNSDEILALIKDTVDRANIINNINTRTRGEEDPVDEVGLEFVTNFIRRAKIIGHLIRSYDGAKERIATDLKSIQQALDFAYLKHQGLHYTEKHPTKKINQDYE